MSEQLTLMAVHAHPDDEVLSTGGILARYSDEGVTTVLVTCTNGEQGDGAGGAKPGEPGHDPAAVVAQRREELAASAAILGVTHVELLGYRDSGMEGWEANRDPGVFRNIPVDVAAGRLAGLMERYRPQVLVAYDANGGYGHPDHIQAHRVAVAAADATGIPARVYYSAIPRSGVLEMRRLLEARGADTSEFPGEGFGVDDDRITAVVDVAAYTARKRAALAAHASQNDNFFLRAFPDEVVDVMLSREAFTLRSAPVRAGEVADDLFAGLRS